MPTFMDRYRRGQARKEDIDAWIDRWHDSAEGSYPARFELHEYLGMTWQEYRTWLSKRELPDLRFERAG